MRARSNDIGGLGLPFAFSGALAALVSVLILAGSPSRLSAQQTPEQLKQQAEQILGRPISDQEILQRLQQSGLTPDQIRQKLSQAGYNPSVADPYLAVMQGQASTVPSGTNPVPLLQVLTQAESQQGAAGAAGAAAQGQAAPGQYPYGQYPPTQPLAPSDTLNLMQQGFPVFGQQLFQGPGTQFQPVTTGPVPPDYRLGPGDEVVLVLTGDVELAYQLTVTREGWIVIPDVGRVFVNGLTLAGLREAMFQRLSQVYSGIQKGPGATTHFDVSIGNLRLNQVYVIGEVEQPAAYQVSSLATALNALYQARGPTRSGSFRNIMVNRGGKTVATIDLYDYLLNGKASEDVRLEQGDIVFVPVAQKRIKVDGVVNRPALYELKPGEGLRDALRYAGGVPPEADLKRVQIARFLPPEERTPGHDQVLLDVPIASLSDSTGDFVPLQDGDRITVFALVREVRHQVTVSGAVWHPGTYGISPGMRMWDLIRQAGGLLPDVFAPRAQIQRLRPDDYTREMIPVDLATGSGGEPVENPKLEEEDQVYIYARRNLREELAVSVSGWVQQPGVYPFVEGMSVGDLVLEAGGLRTGAYTKAAEVSRVVVSQTRQDTLTRRFEVPLDSAYVTGGDSAAARPGGAGGEGSEPAGGRFALHNLDAVFIRKAPGFEPQQNVTIAGEVQFPGEYSLQTRDERLLDLVRRAGGLTGEAYAEGLQLWRKETIAPTDTLSAVQLAGRAYGDTAFRSDTLARPYGAMRGQLPQGAYVPTPDTSAAARQAAAQAYAQGYRLAPGYPPAGQAPPDTGLYQRVRPDTGKARGAIEDQRLAERRAVNEIRTRVGIDFPRARRDPRSSSNILVEPGDSVYVPRFIPTVDVEGAVGVETKVLYKRGEGVDYYINQAGGYAADADKSRVRVRFANGEIDTRGSKFLFFGGGIADPDPGSTIQVPRKPEKSGGISAAQLFGILTSLATATATIVIAVKR